MNNVYFDKVKVYKEYTLEELISCYKGRAFVGRSKSHSDYDIYLVTYDRVISLNDQTSTWSGDRAIFYVKKWVNLDIYAIEE